jgi:formate hydrogenlyase subunit 3/multisubunit Na+/H+ antiporter MnhD subunit
MGRKGQESTLKSDPASTPRRDRSLVVVWGLWLCFDSRRQIDLFETLVLIVQALGDDAVVKTGRCSAAVQADLTWLAILGVVNSVISAYYYLRVVVYMYMQEGVSEATATPVCLALQAGVGVASLAVVVLGLWPAPILDLARMTATALLGG